MNFTKVKTVIIIFLAAINVLLGILCIRIAYDNSYIPEEEMELAQKHLSKIGVSVSFNQSHRKKNDLPIYSLSGDEGGVPEIYKSITEEFFDVSLDDNEYVVTPGGYSVSVKNKQGESLGISSLSDDLNFECAADVFFSESDFSVLKTPYYSSDTLKSEYASDEKIANKLIDRAFGDGEISFVNKGSISYNSGHIIYYVAELSGTEIPELYVNVYVKNKKAVYCAGKIVSGTPKKAYSVDSISAVNILYSLKNYISEDESSTSKQIIVTDIFMTYRMFERDVSEYYIVPAWLINYLDDDGNAKTVILDAVSGENGIFLKE